MEEPAVLEENKYIFSFIFHKILEEWKKIGKKFRRPGKNSGNVGRMEEDRQKFRRPGKNSGNVGRMEEAVEEENNLKLKKIFSFIFHKILEEWKKL